MTQHVTQVDTSGLEKSIRNACAEIDRLRKLVSDAAVEIHMAEVQRDSARASAKAIILDLIEEKSAASSSGELTFWHCGPREFKLAVLARLEKWQ